MTDQEILLVGRRAVLREMYRRAVVENFLAAIRSGIEEDRAKHQGNPDSVMLLAIAEDFIRHVEAFK